MIKRHVIYCDHCLDSAVEAGSNARERKPATVSHEIVCHSKSFNNSYPKMYFLLNLSLYVKSYGHFCQILALFTMPTHQIWSYHLTKLQISELFYFFLILHLLLGKVTKFHVEKFSTSEVSSQKPHGWEGGGGRNYTPSDFRVKGE